MPPRQESPQMYSDIGDAYSQDGDFIRAIRAYKRALELGPDPDLAMLICWNFALAIWLRAGFVNREDTNTTDAEWQEILAARALYRRMLLTYEANFKGMAESRGLPVGKLYQYAKDNLVDTRRYSVSRLPDGTLFPRVEPASFSLDDWLQKQ